MLILLLLCSTWFILSLKCSPLSSGSLEAGQLQPVQLIYCQCFLRIETTKGIDRPDVISLCAVRSRKESSLTVRWWFLSRYRFPKTTSIWSHPCATKKWSWCILNPLAHFQSSRIEPQDVTGWPLPCLSVSGGRWQDICPCKPKSFTRRSEIHIPSSQALASTPKARTNFACTSTISMSLV